MTCLIWGWSWSSVLAEEIPETAIETTTETNIAEQSIATGEAAAEVESHNDVNNNSAVTEGSVSGCQLEINCSNQNNNSAVLDVGNSVVATTGENQSVNNNEIKINIETGEATAAVTNQNQVNTNTLEVATTMAEVGKTEVETIENNNQSETTLENGATATTGENEVVTNNADVVVNTGGATAYTNVINLINTNVVGTNLGIYVVNNFDQGWVDLDLNQMWLKLISGKGVTVIESGINHNKMVVISNKNLAKLNNVVTVAAVSGGNTVTGGNEVLIITGDAVAIANVINLVNVNLVGGQFFIGVVNVLGGNLGNIVLPNPDNFQNSGSTTSGGNGSVVINNNQAVLDNTVVAESDSGNNTTINVDQSVIGTGNATTYSSDLSVVNLNAELNNQMWLQLNVLGEASGRVYNWSYPGSVEEINNHQLLFVLNEGSCLNCQSGNNFLINDNSAEVANSVLVTADSGGNQILGASSGVIESGSAIAIANLTNLVNVNIRGSDWFWGIINILGDWGGDVIFAYPDLAVNLMANKNESRSGEEIIYRINYSNLGYEKVDEAELRINLPVGLDYVSDDSGWLLVQEGNTLRWKLNNVVAKSNSGFNLKVKINNLNDDRDVQLQTVAMIATNSVESDLNNNQSVWATIVWRSVSENNVQNQENGNGVSNKETKIVVEAKNNVNDYVLPNDTVTFLVEVKNVGTGKMKEAVLFHQVFDGQGNLWSENSLYLGDIDINKMGKMAFGLVMSEAGGKYTTKTWIVGFDENNNEVSSNVAETNFWVKRKIVLERGQVLGTENDAVYEGLVNNGICVVKKEKLIYVLLLLVSLMYIQRQVGIWRRKLK
jgi:hypothetical protein